MTEVEFNSILFWSFPIAFAVILGAVLIVRIVMSQRTKRQAIAAGMDAAAYQDFGPRWLALRIGVFLCGIGLAFCLIAAFKLLDDGALAWGVLCLGVGCASVLNHFLLRRHGASR